MQVHSSEGLGSMGKLEELGNVLLRERSIFLNLHKLRWIKEKSIAGGNNCSSVTDNTIRNRCEFSPQLLTLLLLPSMQFQIWSQEKAQNQILINDNSVPIVPLSWSVAGTCKCWDLMFKPLLVLFSYISLSVNKLLYSSPFPTSWSGATVGLPQFWVVLVLRGKVCVALLIVYLTGRTVIYTLLPVCLGTGCSSTRPSSVAIKIQQWNWLHWNGSTLTPNHILFLQSHLGQRQEHTKWWCWNWDCSEVLTGSNPGLAVSKLHAVTALCPRLSQ